MNYRREIDGLRALAVLSVILFHGGFQPFSGGYVGVDVFFVISGFLITSLILAELAKGSFSILKFYERRIRRLFPALFLVAFACVPFAWLYLGANQYRDFSQSLVAVATFTSNLLFWRESGYFDSASELKPLLHTWSLAVEEQYYILFPFFLIFVWKFRRIWILGVTAVAFFTSLSLAQWSINSKPIAGYYLLPTRGWEILLGAMLAIYLANPNRREWSKVQREIGGSLGLIFIASAILIFDRDTPFPGLLALVPTLGTSLVIIFATKTSWIGKAVGNRFLVRIGLISYSAYLWHYPLFVFARHSSNETPSQLTMLSLGFLSIVLGYFSWRFVEVPFRSLGKFSRRQVFSWAISASVTLAVIGFVGDSQNGFAPTLPSKNLESAKWTSENFVIVGDSHGGMLESGLQSITSGSVTNFTSDGCVPFRNVDRYDSRFIPGECANRINSFLDKLIGEDPNAIIILASMGPVYLDGVAFKGKDAARTKGLGLELITDKSLTNRYEVYEIGLRQTLRELLKLAKARTVFTIDVPELGIDFGCGRPSKQIEIGTFIVRDKVNAIDAKDCFVSRKEYDSRVESYKRMINNVFLDYPKATVIDPTDYFCDSQKCTGYIKRFGFLYRDADHLSEGGSRYYAERFLKSLMAQGVLTLP